MIGSNWLCAVLFHAFTIAATASNSLAIKFHKKHGLPQITFPDATYQASRYDHSSDVRLSLLRNFHQSDMKQIYTFSNIRFAAPPVGELRFAKPAPPPKNSTLQTGEHGNACPQAAPVGLNIAGNAASIPPGAALDHILGKLFTPIIDGDTPLLPGGAEDCLFLDVYVPGSAVRDPKHSQLPVIHWFFGGGYILGSKNQLQPILPWYDGSGLISQSHNNVIFVASNYRLGALGFLAGETMEKTGTPNVGFLDQRAALQWTKDNIALLGGDPTQVTAMGESAGASSILHHLVFNGGETDPLFSKAILQSPAFIPMVDRKGSLETVYQNFSTLVGCDGGDIKCLRAADTKVIINANRKLNSQAIPGTFMVGPAADGDLIRQTPALELASGNYWKGLESLMVTHTSDEAAIFVDGTLKKDNDTVGFIKHLFPQYALDAGLEKILLNRYPGIDTPNSPYKIEYDRVSAMVRDGAFVCSVRFLAQTYPHKTYVGRYSVYSGWHGTDLIPLFWSNGIQSSVLGTALEIALPFITLFSQAFKSYFTSFVQSGNPNRYRKVPSLPQTIDWPLATGAESSQKLGNVLEFKGLRRHFHLVDDDQATLDTCQFWQDWLSALTIDGGYAPPNDIVDTPFANSSELLDKASSNYST